MSRPRRIAVALHRWFPHGGLQRDASFAAAELARRGHEVTVHVQRWDGERARDFDVCEHRVPGRSNHGRARAFGRELTRLFGRESYDAVLGFDKLPSLDVYFAGDPCYAARARRKRGPLACLLPRDRTFVALERAVFGRDSRTRILLLDPRERTRFVEHYGTLGERFVPLEVTVAPDRIATDETRERGAALRRARGFGGGTCMLLFLGSDFRRKGLDRVIAALARLPQHVQLVAAGDDDARGMKRLAVRLGVSDRVSIERGSGDAAALLAAADLLVHPAREEPAGLVILEALAAGTPVVCTDACGAARTVRDARAGAVVGNAPFDANELATALSALCEANGRAPVAERAAAFAASRALVGMHGAIADEVERTWATQ